MSPRSSTVTVVSAGVPAEARIDAYDWQALAVDLDGYGCAVLPKLLSPAECRTIAALYPGESHFRSHVHMARHGFGKGEYRYFKYPLPDLLGGLRTALYPRLVGVANAWNERMGIEERYPTALATFLKHCHDAGQGCARHLCCCNTSPATSIACIRICTAISRFRFRLRFCCLSQARILRVASLS